MNGITFGIHLLSQSSLLAATLNDSNIRSFRPYCLSIKSTLLFLTIEAVSSNIRSNLNTDVSLKTKKLVSQTRLSQFVIISLQDVCYEGGKGGTSMNILEA